ncbi:MULTISPECIES: shikimate dehydrogenase [unclassified Variovorax]|uniref:shikimate dehydrogenase n=1 Tax=unclassified Variovorax TaxID=663243 RepID=UPI00076C0115|nr:MULTISPECIES: shikimate dehydrogenase [unclassified Variovorax]KWT74967.1 Shikimate 5-dehydrogenase I alpha [Variovorax sp. WDL1]PNG59786.1 Shikimate dehydrogenase (NADP(+)) [Variovorax sp. B4]PNG60423.1 Shikimate dehydrogenase (NADP(+)) [Variovorax sp. B2]VTV13710.1 Shikimate dehydrogenase [Variovorax sp. WDL1]
MDLYCVMGNPVEHSRSPWIHARFAELTGQALDYGRRLVPLDGFEAAVAAFRAETAGTARGCNITVPFKFEAAALAQHLSLRAMLARAVNTLRFDADGIHGDNTDGAGLVADIAQHAGVTLAGSELLLLGAGGAAAGVLGPLLEAGPRRVVVANRTLAKAIALVRHHAALALQHGITLEAHELQSVPGEFDVMVNGTASSLAGGEVPVPARVLRRGALAVDMMYGPAAAGFMAWAREHGAVPRDGLGMLVEQAAESFAFWRGVRPPSAQVLAELRAVVDGK